MDGCYKDILLTKTKNLEFREWYLKLEAYRTVCQTGGFFWASRLAKFVVRVVSFCKISEGVSAVQTISFESGNVVFSFTFYSTTVLYNFKTYKVKLGLI